MAENVQLRLEEGLGELEQLERIGLFTSAEIRQVVKQRQQFEYKVHRTSKTQEDFLKYIEYEKNLLRLINKRRKKNNCQNKKNEIDYSIINRISKLYRLAEERYKKEISIWFDHIDFCESVRYTAVISKTFTRMLQVHSDKMDVWVAAARWEMKKNNSAETARKLLLRALRYHPESKELFHECFRLELRYIELLLKRKKVMGLEEQNDEEVPDAVLKCGLAKAVYQNAIKTVPTVECHSPFVLICDDFDFAKELKEEILSDLSKLHEKDEAALDFIAQRELISLRINAGIMVDCDKTVEEEINSCLQVYNNAVDKIPTIKMYELYIEACLAMRDKSFYAPFKEFLLTTVKAVFKSASGKKLLSEKLYRTWVGYIENESEKEEILKAALEEYGNSVYLWKKYVHCKIKLETPNDEIQKLFDTAFAAVKQEESLPLWLKVFEWLTTFSGEKAIKFLRNAATTANSEVRKVLRLKYLEMTYLNGGIDEARKVYKEMATFPPTCEKFFWKMLEFEEQQQATSILWMRKVFEDLITNFGKTNVDIWLRYIDMETVHPFGDPCFIPGIHWRAMKTLNKDLENKFLVGYTIFNTNPR